MASTTPCPPAMCASHPACGDTRCPGHPGPLSASDLAAGQRALHTEDGGTWITSGHRVLRLKHSEPESEPSPYRWLDLAFVVGILSFLAAIVWWR